MDNIDARYKDIPSFLKNKKIWLCYDDINYSGDDAKAPRDLKGHKASINNRLFSYNECLASVKNGVNSGLGIVVKPKQGLIVIDYDNCIKGYKKMDNLGLEIPLFNKDASDRVNRDINLIKSYTEISPSGKGIHIYLLANYNINVKTDDIEIYNNHFIRVSGNSLNNYYDLEDKTAEIEQLIKLYGLDKVKDAEIKDNILNSKGNYYKEMLDDKFTKNNVRYQNKYTDKQILDTMFKSKNGGDLQRLYYNFMSASEYKNFKSDKEHIKDISDIDTSNSGKSITLLMYLLHFSYGDIKAVKRLFKNSGLCKSEYLKLKYNNHKSDKIDFIDIPKAIIFYKNYSDELFK